MKAAGWVGVAILATTSVLIVLSVIFSGIWLGVGLKKHDFPAKCFDTSAAVTTLAEARQHTVAALFGALKTRVIVAVIAQSSAALGLIIAWGAAGIAKCKKAEFSTSGWVRVWVAWVPTVAVIAGGVIASIALTLIFTVKDDDFNADFTACDRAAAGAITAKTFREQFDVGHRSGLVASAVLTYIALGVMVLGAVGMHAFKGEKTGSLNRFAHADLAIGAPAGGDTATGTRSRKFAYQPMVGVDVQR